ncbi:DUF4297 family anti-phage-associated protein [uncultured Flavobacterium sp.]|uniref:DUF4297 family anti-phage-associated protein n=1 Tax=uncultured Flavobacterium sp. TaxID=165435 RepID=UPI0025FE5431|nr:DUF4297 family anti-phage-associated protein [uncultured Flavobacterium sp.]
MVDRTAIDTIKGYFYQFDLSILELLKLKNDSDSITVEGIEDIDIKTATDATAIQCKYYAKSDYNHSKIAKPIRLMLNHFSEAKKLGRTTINYTLYGFFKVGSDKLIAHIDIDFLKNHFLTYKRKTIKHYHHNDLGLSDSDLEEFLLLLKIDISGLEYNDQLAEIFKLLKSEFNCSEFEAEHFYYNNALNLLKSIAVENKVAKRKITKKNFIEKINIKQVLFSEWFLLYKGQEKVFSELRKQYFTNLNTSSFERFFLIEVPNIDYSRSEIKELLFLISRKWSKLSAREPQSFCPYIYIHNLPKGELLELKKEMYSEGFGFLDGFNFEGSTFNAIALIQQATFVNGIKLKIINKNEYIEETLKTIKKTKEVYEFYVSDTFSKIVLDNINHVRIKVNKLSEIKKII